MSFDQDTADYSRAIKDEYGKLEQPRAKPEKYKAVIISMEGEFRGLPIGPGLAKAFSRYKYEDENLQHVLNMAEHMKDEIDGQERIDVTIAVYDSKGKEITPRDLLNDRVPSSHFM
ncbi:MAG: hypothetical protein KJ906_02425 [Nanoarchaeota archaeon]|nr:hypothetical protein [Nanoarchaeota archaeon]